MASSELETIKIDTPSTEIKTKKGARGKYKGSLVKKILEEVSLGEAITKICKLNNDFCFICLLIFTMYKLH